MTLLDLIAVRILRDIISTLQYIILGIVHRFDINIQPLEYDDCTLYTVQTSS